MKLSARSILLVVALAACSDDNLGGPGAAPPRILQVQAAPLAGLTAQVTVSARGLDSVRLDYQGAPDGPRQTPAMPAGDTTRMVVVGLHPGSSYTIRVTGWKGGTPFAGDSTSYHADTLPVPLRALQVQMTGTPGSGYTIVPIQLDTTGYLVALDSTGTVRWFLNTSLYYPNVRAEDLKQMPNGHIFSYIGGSSGSQPIFGQFYEFTVAGQVARTYAVTPPLYTDGHELQLQYSDTTPVSAVLLGYDIRTTDLTSIGGLPTVALAGHQLIRQRLDGTPMFFWNAWDHFPLAEWTEEPQSSKQLAATDFDHPNSVDIDLDGNYIVSWRNFGEITKIDARTGAFIWRWGGLSNQFTFVNDPEGFFSGEHCVRVLPNGHYLLYDNGLRHQPPETRVAEYQLDPVAHTATLVWEYHHTPAIYTAFMGYVGRLVSGNTFIGWGSAGVIQEVTPAKATVWEGTLTYKGLPALFYRAIRVPDLYRYKLP